jgi:transcriptional regulator with XRE-family HTH domain
VTVHIEEALHVDLLERARMPSIRDVARLAGVSHQTVSRVLNDHPSIRPETKERVLDAIRVLDYRPNVAARALATSRSNTLGSSRRPPASSGRPPRSRRSRTRRAEATRSAR